MANFLDLFRKKGAAPKLTVEEKLHALAQCGITLRPPFQLDELLSSYERADFDKDGFGLLLSAIAGTEEAEPWRHRSLQVYNFDMECIEDEQAYGPIVAGLARMLEPDLQISGFSERLDMPDEDEYDGSPYPARIAFTCNGRKVEYSFMQKDDWFEVPVLLILGALLAESGSKRVLFSIDTGGQDATLGVLTREQVQQLAALPGMPQIDVLDERFPVEGCTVTDG